MRFVVCGTTDQMHDVVSLAVGSAAKRFCLRGILQLFIRQLSSSSATARRSFGKRTISGGTAFSVKPPDGFAASYLMSNSLLVFALALFRTEAQISVEGENFVVDKTKSCAAVMTAHVNLLDAFFRGIETELLPRRLVDEKSRLLIGSVFIPVDDVVGDPLPPAIFEVEPDIVPVGAAVLLDAKLGLHYVPMFAARFPRDSKPLPCCGVEFLVLVPVAHFL
jgi:hypothetical protein